ncbi:MAG: AIR synthase related protein [Marinilabiliales bacterium]|nr:AIR synthase related protein [Marinilabiliales bacterium]
MMMLLLLIQANKLTLVSTDLLLEGIHFNLIYTPLKHLGYKAVIRAISDIYAMNGTPGQILDFPWHQLKVFC